MEQKIIVGVLLGIIVVSIVVFLLYQAQESQPKAQDYEPTFDEIDLLDEYIEPVGGVPQGNHHRATEGTEKGRTPPPLLRGG